MEYITNDILQKAENIANMANNLTIDDLLNLGIYNQYKFIYSGQPFNLQTNSKLGILNFLQSKKDYIPKTNVFYDKKFDCSDCELDSLLCIYDTLQKVHSRKYFKNDKTITTKEIDFPNLNYDGIVQLLKMYKTPVFYTDLQNDGLYNTLVLSEFKKMGYTVSNDGIGKELASFVTLNESPKKLKEMIGTNISPTLNFLLNNYNNKQQAAQQITNITIKDYINLDFCESITSQNIVDYLRFLREINSIGAFSIPNQFCKLSFVLFVSALRFFSGKEITIRDGILVVNYTLAKSVNKPSDFCEKMNNIISKLSVSSSFDDLSYLFVLNNFVKSDIDYLTYHLQNSDNILCSFICAAVLKYKFKLVWPIALKYYWHILQLQLKTKTNTNCCGQFIINSSTQDRTFSGQIVSFKKPIFESILTNIMNSIKTTKEYYMVLNRLSFPKQVLWPFLEGEKTRLSTFVAHLLIKQTNFKQDQIYLSSFLEKPNIIRSYAQPLTDIDKAMFIYYQPITHNECRTSNFDTNYEQVKDNITQLIYNY